MKTRNLRLSLCTVFTALLILMHSNAFSASRYSVASGSWNSTSTWSASSGGASGASFPVAGDVVYIENGHTITVTSDAGAASVTFSKTSGTLTVNLGATLALTGALKLYHNVNNSSSCLISGAGILTCASVEAGSTTALNGSYSAIMTITLSSLNVSGNVIINAHESGNAYPTTSFRVEEGTTTVGGQIVSTISDYNSGTSTIMMNTGLKTGTLALSGTTPWGTLTGITVTLTGTSSSVEYKGSTTQTILGTSYTNLKINNGGTATLGAGTTVNGTFYMTKGTFALGGKTLNWGTSSALVYNGAGAQTTGPEWPASFSKPVTIANTSNVVTIGTTAFTGTTATTTINSGATLATAAGTFTAAGPMTINGSFQINQGGKGAGNTWTYTNGTLIFNNSTGSFGVNNGDVFWPTTNAPTNVTIKGAGGITLNAGAIRTVSGVFQTYAGVTLTGTLTCNGPCQINTGGYFNQAPVYGSSSFLIYNTGTNYTAAQEWSTNTIGTGAGVPQNVTIAAGSSLSFTGAFFREMRGNLNFSKPAPSTSTLSLSTITGGDLLIGGNWNKASGGVFLSNGRLVSFNGSAIQTITASSGETFDNFEVKNSSGVSLMDNITINNNLMLTSGLLTTGSKIVTLGAAATISNASSTSYVNGIMARIYTETGSKDFAIGKGGNYRPINLDYTAFTGSSTVTAEQFEGLMPGSTPDNTSKFTARYWTISESGGASFAYKLTLNPTGFSPTGTAVMLLGDGTTNQAIGVTTPNYTNASDLNSFSTHYGLADLSSPIVYDVTGSGSYCAGGIGLPVGLSGSQAGITYTLYKDDGTMLPTIAGTGSAISFGDQSGTHTYTVKASNLSGTPIAMNGSALITMNPMPAEAGIVTGSTSVCLGESGVAYSVPAIAFSDSYDWQYSGSGVTISNGTTNSINISFGAEATSGNLTVYGVNTCANGIASISFPIVVKTVPLAAGTIKGTAAVCNGQNNIAYSVPEIANSTTYTWNFTGTGATFSNETTNQITISFDATAIVGDLTVMGVNQCGNGIVSASFPIAFGSFPEAAGSISGIATLCAGQDSISYEVPSILNATSYIWNYSGTGATIIDETTNQIKISFTKDATSGNLTVMGTNLCGNGTASETFAISLGALPAAAGSITGTASLCGVTGNIAYSVPVISNATSYSWYYSGTAATINNGTTDQISITFTPEATSGNLTVVGTNSCGNGTVSANFPILLNASPEAAGLITGSSAVCSGQNDIAFSVAAVVNATNYEWSYSGTGITVNNSTTNAITISFAADATSGNLSVMGQNACGDGTVSVNFAISVNTHPSAAGAISGDLIANQGQENVVYSIAEIPGVTSYSWILPGGYVGSSSTNSITLSFSGTAISDTIKVKGSNECGEGDFSALAVNINKNIQLKVLLEGLYNSASQNMTAPQNQSGNHYISLVADQIQIELRDAASANDILLTVPNQDLLTDGTCSFYVPSRLMLSYYLVIRHRNHLETWSAQPVSFSGSGFVYDFTDAASKAFGDNLAMLATGVYGIYAGDVTNDGMIDATDLTALTTDAGNFMTGYVVTDINGDGVVDSKDLILTDNNSALFVGVKKPQ